MASPHVIRLRGPWEWEAVAGDVTAAGRTQLPGAWSELVGDDFRGLVRYCRAFNRPTNLEPHERVWLVLAGLPGEMTLQLNGRPLEGDASGEPRRFDITPLLALHNKLSIETADPGGIAGEVRLEIA